MDICNLVIRLVTIVMVLFTVSDPCAPCYTEHETLHWWPVLWFYFLPLILDLKICSAYLYFRIHHCVVVHSLPELDQCFPRFREPRFLTLRLMFLFLFCSFTFSKTTPVRGLALQMVATGQFFLIIFAWFFMSLTFFSQPSSCSGGFGLFFLKFSY